MSKLKFIILCTTLAVLTSCATTSRFRVKSSDQLPIVKGEIQQVSKIATYSVDTQKVQGSYSGTYERKLATRSIELAKELAIGDAISKAKCDFLISPMYDAIVDGKSIIVNVSGYPAHYTEFITQTATDSVQIVTQKYAVVPSTTQQEVPKTKTHEKKGRGKKILKILGITYLAGALITLAISSSY